MHVHNSLDGVRFWTPEYEAWNSFILLLELNIYRRIIGQEYHSLLGHAILYYEIWYHIFTIWYQNAFQLIALRYDWRYLNHFIFSTELWFGVVIMNLEKINKLKDDVSQWYRAIIYNSLPNKMYRLHNKMCKWNKTTTWGNNSPHFRRSNSNHDGSLTLSALFKKST